ncbi:helix-turn-helix domain-containing protein [Actinophytocola gossypii]|uniref:helix-turn-helix domain-containing protein n=1 Tax=Actinophytocola gossypii TaxID=2812003 RepID=UPI0021A89455|nr:helix-turn-helix transcriptional regulator [Actinophytocola gossypii]
MRWLVGVELTRFRERVGKKITEAAKVINCSAGKVGHMESGRNQQQPAEVRDLLRFYRADQADIDRLSSLAGSAGQQTWWAPWTDVVPDWLRTFVGLEGLASRSSIYAPLVLPALLQTEAYALGVTAGNLRVRPDHDERTVSLRMERQRRLFDEEHPLRLAVMLEEVVLDRPIGGAGIMRAQLERLVELGQRDNVELRILPTALGAHDALVGPFTVLDFAEAQSIGYAEMVNGAVYVQDQAQVAGYTRIVHRLREVALSPEQTADLIRTRLTALT